MGALLLQQALNRAKYGDDCNMPSNDCKEHRKPASSRVTKTPSTTKQSQPSNKLPTPPMGPLPTNEPCLQPQILPPTTTTTCPLVPNSNTAITDLIILDGPSTLPAWLHQTTVLATHLSCLSHLHQNPSPAPPTTCTTLPDYLTAHHRATALNLILSRLAPPVFAYMRVLGYNQLLGPNPRDALEYAQRAASRLGMWAVAEEDEEVYRLVFEWRFAGVDVYPSTECYLAAQEWLGGVLRARAKVDERVREVVERLSSAAGEMSAKKREFEELDEKSDVKRLCGVREESPVTRLKLTAKRTPIHKGPPVAVSVRPRNDTKAKGKAEYCDAGLLTPRMIKSGSEDT